MGAAASCPTHPDTPATSRDFPGPRSTLLLLPALPRPCVVECEQDATSFALSRLQDAVLQEVCSQQLHRFVVHSWRPGSNSCSSLSPGEDDLFRVEGGTLALNCIDFVHEVPALPRAPLPACRV